ncbi:uncharacterized protein LOC123428944 [Hordeum vulgare subsp. vulgare]|uniref:uncharacterized protein LOC123428944 n=1 Tax=Hordeum vulgare subsp. vulgare TaxID=112509 RepID=UPI001D1A5330|nr:uncharacterized protein LOC123428944 [Hordeum vulgare subsp. vulgare]
MSTRWMLGRKKWSTKIAKNCYPIYHDQFELLNDSLITWNPWTEAHIDMVFGSQHMPVECVRDSAFWMTRCNLLYLWFVEPYNPDRVMRQFGLYQDIPPPVPRCIDEETHKMSNMGRSGVDWNAENIEWINQWNNEALQNIVPQQRTYDATTTEAYYNWYRMSTRTRLTSEPPTMPTHPTHMEQLQRRMDTSSAYYRDSAIDICTQVQAMASEGMRAEGSDPKRRSWFKKISEFVSTRITRCGTENDVVTAAYNIPEPRSARPSGAPSSSMRWAEGRNTMPTLPRHDSSLPIHGQTSQVNAPDVGSTPEQTHFMEQDAYTAYDAHIQGSQPYLPTRGIRMPEENRWAETCEGAQSYNSGQVAFWYLVQK